MASIHASFELAKTDKLKNCHIDITLISTMKISNLKNRLFKSIAVISFTLGACSSCLKSTRNTAMDSLKTKTNERPSITSNSLYAQLDTLFNVNGKRYKISIQQYDVTEVVASKGDSTFAPAYSFVINITNSDKKILLQDSLDRNSWGFPGKFNSIDHYEMAMPSFEFDRNELITTFLISDRESGYAITGKVSYNIKTQTARYFWNEADIGD
jgi:hypothetical protein